jgi:hypothetical protein
LQWFLASAQAQTATTIPANEAAAHIGEYATVEGVVAKVFTSKSGNTFMNIGASYPNQTFTGWIPPASPVNKSPVLSGIEGKRVKIIGQIKCKKGSRKFGSTLLFCLRSDGRSCSWKAHDTRTVRAYLPCWAVRVGRTNQLVQLEAYSCSPVLASFARCPCPFL